MANDREVVRVKASDGHEFNVGLFRADQLEARPWILCLPAMGARASFYEPFVVQLCRAVDAHAALMDLRGIETSSVRASRRENFGYREIIRYDIPAALARLGERTPRTPILILGHSLGGQLGCLFAAANPDAVSGLILIATCSVYYRMWAFPHNYGVFTLQHFALATSTLIGHYPGRRLGFGGREARGVIRDWARQGRTGAYRVTGESTNFERLLAEIRAPLLSIRMRDDYFAPERAAEHLLAKMFAAEVTRRVLDPRAYGLDRLGHFGWVKRAEPAVSAVQEWFSEVGGFEGQAPGVGSAKGG